MYFFMFLLLISLFFPWSFQLFRALRSILHGFVAFFTACNRHRLRCHILTAPIIFCHIINFGLGAFHLIELTTETDTCGYIQWCHIKMQALALFPPMISLLLKWCLRLKFSSHYAKFREVGFLSLYPSCLAQDVYDCWYLPMGEWFYQVRSMELNYPKTWVETSHNLFYLIMAFLIMKSTSAFSHNIY